MSCLVWLVVGVYDDIIFNFIIIKMLELEKRNMKNKKEVDRVIKS